MAWEYKPAWEDWPLWQPNPNVGIRLAECPKCKALVFEGNEYRHWAALHEDYNSED